MTPKNALRTEPKPATSPTGSPTAPLRLLKFEEPRPRILYVDDDASIRRFGQLVLARSDCEVDSAVDGMEAWDALREVNYDLLITDHEMPRLCGLELATRARLAGMRLPIVLASDSEVALHDPSTAWLDLAARLPKPFGTGELLATVEQALHSANNSRSCSAAMISVRERLAQTQPYTRWGINE